MPWDLSMGSVRSILPFLRKPVAALPQLRAFSTQDQEFPKTPLNLVRMYFIPGERKHGPRAMLAQSHVCGQEWCGPANHRPG
jgi:hypothetical protein